MNVFGRKIQKKNPPQNPPAENIESAGTRPPRNPPARPKNPPQNPPTNPPVKPPSTRRVFSIEKDCSWRRFRSSEHGFWDTLWLPSGHGQGSHVEMHLQFLSCCLWDGQGLLRTLPDNTFSQKRSFSENSPKITKKSATRLCHIWQPNKLKTRQKRTQTKPKEEANMGEESQGQQPLDGGIVL